jgi:hypothetical protein
MARQILAKKLFSFYPICVVKLKVEDGSMFHICLLMYF